MRLWALLVLVSVASAATNTTGFFDALFSGILSKDPSQRDNGFRRLLGAVLPDRCQGLIDASQTSSVPSDGCLDSMLSGLRAKNGSLLETLSGTVARSRDQLKDELTRSLKAMLPDICSEAVGGERLAIDVSGRPSSVGRPAMRGGANVSSMLDQIFQSFPQVVQPPAQSVASRLMSAGEAQPVEGRLFVDGTWRNLQCQLVDPVTRHASATPDLPVIARLIQSQLVPIREVLLRSEAASPVVGSTRPTPPASRGLKPAARPDSTTAPGLGVGGRFEEGDFTVRGSTSSVPPLALAFLLSYTLSLL